MASVEEGVDALLARDPAAVDMVRELGLADRLEAPVTTAARVWRDGVARPLPGGTVLGLPTDLPALARSGVLSAAGLARVPLDLVAPGSPVQGDVPVGRLVARRLGGEVVDRLLDPLLGGVYAGRAEHLSLRATLPLLARAAAGERSLLRAAAAVRPAPSAAPVFLGLRGGFSTLVESLVADVRDRGGTVLTGATVRDVTRTSRGLRLEVGAAGRPAALHARALVLATPAPATARLLRSLAPSAAVELGGVDMAGVALVSLALPAGSLAPPPGSGLLVPAVEGRTVKAVTFASRKWAHLRASAGGARAGAGVARPVRGGGGAAARRRGPRGGGPRRPGRPGRLRRDPAGGRPGEPLGRRPAAVRGGARRPGGPRPCGAARAGRARGRIAGRRGGPRLRPVGAAGGGAGAGRPRRAPRRRQR